MFAFLAAVYLTLETKQRDLQEDFRLRARVSGVVVFPSYYYLFRVFKRENALTAIGESPDKIVK